jgi:glycosyltransferase involved in cell wall biosynthesis
MHHIEKLPALSKPSVSVVVCNYNYERYIKQALDSLLKQTLSPLEVVVVDDGSTDNSLSIIQAMADSHGLIRVISQPNGGQIAAYNTGFLQTRGDIVYFLDSDDLLYPNALEVIANSFAANIAKVHFKLDLINPDSQRLGVTIPDTLTSGHVATIFLKHGIPHASPPASGNAYRRSVLEKLFPLPASETDRHGADFFCIYGTTLLGDVATCSGVLGLYRVHQKTTESAALVFGNAEKGHQLDVRFQKRYNRFHHWIFERTQGAIKTPAQMLDFSIQKTAFATAVLAQNGFWVDIKAAISRLPSLIKSIFFREDFSYPKKVGLLAWSLLLIVAPRAVALPAAEYVCNPSSRMGGKGRKT